VPHKLGPALVAGNAVILKPARVTLLIALAVVVCFVDVGQVCISVQRVIAHPKISGDFLDALVPRAEVNSAGLTCRGTLLDTTPELFDQHIAVNLRVGSERHPGYRLAIALPSEHPHRSQKGEA